MFVGRIANVFLLVSVGLFSSFIETTTGDRVISSADIETLQLAQVIFRHGARSPLSSYDKDPYNNSKFWPDGLGQLTAKGKLMEYELGEYIRWRYTGFVNRTYTAPQVYAQSSDIDRAIMSAELVLAGMFPPTEDAPSSMWSPSIRWQPIPVHTISMPVDNKIAYAAKCPRYDKLFDEYLKTPEFVALDAKNEEMYKFLSEKTKTNITNLLGVNDLHDVLYIQEYNKLKLPDWASRYYPEHLKSVAEKVWEILVPTDEMKRLRMGPLLGELVKNMDKRVQRQLQEEKYENQLENNENEVPANPDAKLYLYSGHDSTVAALLGALGIFERQIPSYSAAVFVELHKEKPKDDIDSSQKKGHGKFFVKVFFRNETDKVPYEMKIPNCGAPCTFSQLKQLLQKTVISDWNTWQRECQQTSTFSLTRAKHFFQGIPKYLKALYERFLSWL